MKTIWHPATETPENCRYVFIFFKDNSFTEEYLYKDYDEYQEEWFEIWDRLKINASGFVYRDELPLLLVDLERKDRAISAAEIALINVRGYCEPSFGQPKIDEALSEINAILKG